MQSIGRIKRTVSVESRVLDTIYLLYPPVRLRFLLRWNLVKQKQEESGKSSFWLDSRHGKVINSGINARSQSGATQRWLFFVNNAILSLLVTPSSIYTHLCICCLYANDLELFNNKESKFRLWFLKSSQKERVNVICVWVCCQTSVSQHQPSRTCKSNSAPKINRLPKQL